MIDINSARFRRNMYSVFNACVETSEPVTVTTTKLGGEKQQMVIISKAQYDMMINKINGDK